MRKLLTKSLKYSIVFCILIACYFLLLTITSCIPSSWMQAKVKPSAIQLEELGEKTVINRGWKQETLFNFTDALMINTAYSIDSSHPIESFLTAKKNYIPNVTTKIYTDTPPPNTDNGDTEAGKYGTNVMQTKELRNLTNGIVQEANEYARYWHGYLVLLRPLLLLTDYQGIQIISIVAMLASVFTFVYLLYKKINWRVAIVFLVGLLSINIITITLSTNAILVFFIAILMSIYILLRYSKIKNIGLLFFIIGSFTSFIDLLTTPIVTLGIPLFVWFLLEQKNKQISLKTMLIDYGKLIALWGIGYGLTWFSKWVLTDIILGRHVIVTAMEQLFYRIGNNADGNLSLYTVNNAFALNFNYFGIKIIEIIVLLSLAFIGIGIYKHKEIHKENIIASIPYILISILPFVWLCILKNHCIHHPFFTNRMFVIAVVGFGLTVISIFGLTSKQNQEVKK